MQRVAVTSSLHRLLRPSRTPRCCMPCRCASTRPAVSDADNDDDNAEVSRACCSSSLSSSRSLLLLHAQWCDKRDALHALVRRQQQCEAAARRFAHACLWAVWACLCAQTLVLFYWTYVVFDWNTVEPLTYLLGYGLTWLSIAWYGVHRSDLTCDTARAVLERRRAASLCRAADVDATRVAALRAEVARLARHVRATHELQQSADSHSNGSSSSDETSSASPPPLP